MPAQREALVVCVCMALIAFVARAELTTVDKKQNVDDRTNEIDRANWFSGSPMSIIRSR